MTLAVRMRYFGGRWDAPILDGAVEIDAPEGELCLWCQEPIVAGDSGWIYLTGEVTHTECGIRSAVGGVNHQLGLCSCQGGPLPPDPPGMTSREAARAAVKLFSERGHG